MIAAFGEWQVVSGLGNLHWRAVAYFLRVSRVLYLERYNL
jgi:hypothetical protein